MTAASAPSPTVPAPTPVAVLRARGRVRGGLPLLGPAFVAAIAYVDPGNFATNFSGGARYGYLLLWVIVAANGMAMLVQSLSAKAGLATGLNLAELCREQFPRRVSQGLWVQAELVAMATDLAEVVGGAIALQLLFGLPLLLGGVITGAVAFALLGLQRRGYRRFELVVGWEREGGSSKELSRSRGGHGRGWWGKTDKKEVSGEGGWAGREDDEDEMEGRRMGRTEGELLENLTKRG